MLFLILLIAILPIVLFLVQRGRKPYIPPEKRIKGPRGLPFIGVGLDFINLGPLEAFKKLEQYTREYGDLVCVELGPDQWIIVANPSHVEVNEWMFEVPPKHDFSPMTSHTEQIMTSTSFLEKSMDYDFLKPWLGTGLLTSTGEKWHQRRKMLTSAFHFKILDDFVEVFDRQADILVQKLARQKPDQEFDVAPFVTLYTLDVICESAMGVKVSAQTNKESNYVKSIVEISSLIYWRMFHVLARENWYWRWTSQGKRHNELVKSIHEFTDSVIESRRKVVQTESKDKVYDSAPEEDDVGSKKRMALLDLLLRSTIDDKPLTNDDIREEVDSFMFAGHDTTTSGINFLLYNLAANPDVQQKAFEEIRRVFGDDKDEPISLRKLNELKYLDLVIKESLRMFPPVPYIGRQLREDVEIGGMFYPKGVNVLVSIHMLHKQEKFFPEPEKFIPERFDVVKSAEKMNPFVYIPFSSGFRNCVGQKFAQYEIKSVLSKILRNFEVVLGHEGFEPILLAEIILKPANGIMLKFRPRVYA